ncbi:hypothetical protein D3C75_1255230 [compost metagenome]
MIGKQYQCHRLDLLAHQGQFLERQADRQQPDAHFLLGQEQRRDQQLQFMAMIGNRADQDTRRRTFALEQEPLGDARTQETIEKHPFAGLPERLLVLQ